MRKLYSFLFISILGLTGCTQTYNIHTAGFAQSNDVVPKNARIFVIPEPNTHNPLISNEARTKIQKLLLKNNYQVVNNEESADYTLAYQLSFQPQESPDYEYMERYGAHGYRGPAYVPRINLVWNQWLRLKLYHAGNLIWTGEVQTTKGYGGKNKFIDYLLIAAFEFFGRDSHGEQNIIIRQNDPRIAELEKDIEE